MPFPASLQAYPPQGSTVGKPDLQAAAVEYLGQGEARTAELDGTLLDAVSHEAGALGSDVRIYLRYARCIEALGYVAVYLAMPALAYLLFIGEHPRLAALAFGTGLIGVAVHVVAAPYRCQDRRRANALLQRSRDLCDVLGRRPVSTQNLRAALDGASGAGMVVDSWVFDLVQRMPACDEAGHAADRCVAGAAVERPR
jgi:hypothetical protein